MEYLVETRAESKTYIYLNNLKNKTDISFFFYRTMKWEKVKERGILDDRLSRMIEFQVIDIHEWADRLNWFTLRCIALHSTLAHLIYLIRILVCFQRYFPSS